MVSRMAHNHETVGSSPTPATNNQAIFGTPVLRKMHRLYRRCFLLCKFIKGSENMTQKQNKLIKWLNRALYAEKKLNALKRLTERDKKRAKDISVGNNAEKVLTTLAASEEKYNRFLEKYNNSRAEIEKTIESLHDDKIEAIFIDRYLNNMTTEQIAEKMHYSVITIERYHKKGIEKLIISDND